MLFYWEQAMKNMGTVLAAAGIGFDHGTIFRLPYFHHLFIFFHFSSCQMYHSFGGYGRFCSNE